ncbi:Maf family protein [Piscinibacter terrae]|uniref:dTTP/UTP pyrophosphatase n=1 Tax=Piscinibacter terrae TaxID=2496871 RepID=A0A3N7I073_9BURK|nr:Maf family protein [Albitalea terrae]RQP26771.1 septum formation inhibitor Maf [Albitalea terrae]
MPHDFVYLASQSPRRRQLLTQLGVRHELLLADAHEDAESLEAEIKGEAPHDYVHRVTLAKLDAAKKRRKHRGLAPSPILCSDTTVAIGRRILGKPADADDAFNTLSMLSGRTHRVITGVAVAWGRRQEILVNVSKVHFAPVSEQEIRRYIDGGEPFGKAGAYAIQSTASAWISRIEGSYSGIMGLPLYETAQLMKQAKVRF